MRRFFWRKWRESLKKGEYIGGWSEFGVGFG
jgi:hypothetical protein